MNLAYLLYHRIIGSYSITIGIGIKSTGATDGSRWVDRIPIGVDRDTIGSPTCYASSRA